MDASYGLAHVLLQVTEGLEGEGWTETGLRLDGIFHIVIAKAQHPAVGVVDEHDLAGAQQALGYHQRAYHVVADHTAGVADHMGVAFLQAQQLVGVETSVHAGYDSQILGRGCVPDAGVETLGVLGVVY